MIDLRTSKARFAALLIVLLGSWGCSAVRAPGPSPVPCSRVVLEPPPPWTASAAWNPGETEMLLIDPMPSAASGRRQWVLHEIDPSSSRRRQIELPTSAERLRLVPGRTFSPKGRGDRTPSRRGSGWPSGRVVAPSPVAGEGRGEGSSVYRTRSSTTSNGTFARHPKSRCLPSFPRVRAGDVSPVRKRVKVRGSARASGASRRSSSA